MKQWSLQGGASVDPMYATFLGNFLINGYFSRVAYLHPLQYCFHLSLSISFNHITLLSWGTCASTFPTKDSVFPSRFKKELIDQELSFGVSFLGDLAQDQVKTSWLCYSWWLVTPRQTWWPGCLFRACQGLWKLEEQGCTWSDPFHTGIVKRDY